MLLLLMPLKTMADGYSTLWKQVTAAQQKDLPKTQIGILKKIAGKAKAEAQYGQLLKAQTLWADIEASISPDSIPAAVARMEADAAAYEKIDPGVAAVYYAVLSSLYGNNRELGDNSADISARYAKQAMADPGMLAQKKATDLQPFVVKGRDSKYFNDDLLSLIGYHVRDFKTMHDYYEKTGNRLATMFTALDMARKASEDRPAYNERLEKSRYIVTLDSLINIYSDLTECGEIASERYNYMTGCRNVSTEDQVNYINWALNRWGAWRGTNTLRNAMKSLTCPQFSIRMDNSVINSGTNANITIQAQHLNTVTVRLSRLNLDGSTTLAPGNPADLKTLRSKIISGSAINLTRSFAGHPDWKTVVDSVKTGNLQTGVYLLEAFADNSDLRRRCQLLYVTDLYLINQKLPGNQTRVAAVNAITGQPVEGAVISVKLYNNDKLSLTTDAGGEATVSNSKGDINTMRATTAADKAMPWVSGYNNFSYYDNKAEAENVEIYTDRAIYRPGQTVHASIIAFNRKGTETKAAGGKSIKIVLKDANYKVVTEKTVTTDAYGVASADFTLPSGGLTGRFLLQATGFGNSIKMFGVEEYKRPTFKIELPDVKERYHNGDTLIVVGHAKAYSGVPVQGAAVSYKVSRKQALWWRIDYGTGISLPDGGDIAEATDTTGRDGEFTLKIPMTLPIREDIDADLDEEGFKRLTLFYNIITDIKVTDVSGETRTSQLSLPLGSKAAVLGVDLPDMTLRDSLRTITFSYKNAAGYDIPGIVTYSIDGSQAIHTATANSETKIEWNTAETLKSGTHTLTAVCGTDTVKQKFTVFSLDDTVPCVTKHNWFYATGDKFGRNGEPVYIQVGSSDKDVCVFYTVISGNNVIERSTFNLSNSIKKIAFPYKEEYGAGVIVSCTWVKDGILYCNNARIERPLPDKTLNLKWVTFRDRLTPGQKEEWTLNISRPDGKAADASLMAALYDSSLDQLAPFSWGLQLGLYQSLPYTSWRGISRGEIRMNEVADFKSLDTNPFDLNRMVFAEVLGNAGQALYFRNSTRLARIEKHAAVSPKAPSVKEEAQMRESKVFDTVERLASGSQGVVAGNAEVSANNAKKEVATDAASIADGSSADNVQARENLNETAFFYPSVLSDTAGNVNISFTLPESITTWRFKGLAHDRDMNYGSLSGMAVAKKKVMIQPNMPRFLRAGDAASLTAKIFNTTDKKVKGTATLLLIDPETEQVVERKSVKFAVEDSATTTAAYSFTLTDKYPVLICKVIAEGKDFSDGEQHYLPVLPDKEMITNTVPFIQTDPGVKTINLKPLFSDGATHKRLTVEYTNNPAWLTLQALSYVGTVRDNDVISLATAVYANSIGLNIVSNTPRIKSVFEQWSRESDTSQSGSLASQLSKNSDLKALVLNETPWVMDADNEAEQKRSLANFFDQSGMENRINLSVQAMAKLQNADGSWSWWPGMAGSPRLTSTVMQMMARLSHLVSNQNADNDMCKKALAFLNKKATDEVEKMKKAEREKLPVSISDHYALQYLYINALYGNKLTAKEESAAQYLLAYLKKNNAQNSLYSKALMAVVLAQRGDKASAQDYVQSLEEYTVATGEMGRYYDSRRAEYCWLNYRIPTQVAAIEAMQLVDARKYSKEIEEMRRWLLREKQTQAWDTPINSADAVYAFLNGNKDVLASKPETVLKVDGKQLEMPEATAGLGYVKTSAVNPDGSTLTATKTSEGISWGAVYAQSLQTVGTSEPSSSGLSITREVLKADGSKATDLEVGDKVKVKITINADRDYDFVMVKDNRAACMEPASQLSGYRRGYYCTPKDCSTNYYFDMMSKGKHVIETEYYIDRAGRYDTGSCTVQCAYSPEYTARTTSLVISVQ